MKTLLTTILVVYSIIAVSQVIPDSLLFNFSQAGLIEEIPEPSLQINFLDVGGNGDGITPNDMPFSDMLIGITEPTVIYFPPGAYLFNQSMILKSDVILRGASADSTHLLFDLSGAGHAIRVIGGAETDTVDVVSNIQKGSYDFSVANSGLFAPGDWFFLLEDDQDLIFSPWAEHSTGQINQIESLNGDDIIAVHSNRRDYDLNQNPRIIKLNPIKNVGIENLSIQRLDATTTQTANIRFRNAVNCSVKCIESFNCNYAHIEVNRSSNIEVTGSYIHDAFDFGNGGKAYGVMLTQTSGECLVKENIFDSLRHAMILQAGANGNAFIFNYSVSTFWTDVGGLPANSAGDAVLHGNYPYRNLFEGNVVQNIIIDNSHELNGPGNIFFRNRAKLYGILMNNNASIGGQVFVGNEITNSGMFLGNYLLSGTDHFEYGNNQLGNVIPAGTDDLETPSLYYGSVPIFYDQNNSWPPIGYPNELGEFTNETEFRLSENISTKCEGDSLVSGVEDILDISYEVLLFPNPTRNQIQISSNLDLAKASVAIYDITGKMITEFEYKEIVNLNFLEPGLYFLHIELAGGYRIDKKFVLN